MKKLIAVLAMVCLLMTSVAMSEESDTIVAQEVDMLEDEIELEIAAEVEDSIPEEVVELTLPVELSNQIGEPLEPSEVEKAEIIAANTFGIAIDENNFPDATFRSYVQIECDKNGDCYLSDEEIDDVKSIDLYNTGIETLAGIEFFTGLEGLYCDDNRLTSLNVSQNTKLTYLECQNNQLRTLTIGDNRNLEVLYCWNNQLTEMDIGGCPALDFFHCAQNSFNQMDFSGNPALLKIIQEYGTYFDYGKNRIDFVHPQSGWGSDESSLSFDRRVIITSKGKLLYSPDKPLIKRTLDPVTIGSGEDDDGIMYNTEVGSNTPKWITSTLNNGKNTYKSSNSKIVKVDNKKGVIKGVKAGKATVTLTSSLGVEITRTVNVKKAPSKISLSKKKMTLLVDEEKAIRVKLPSGTASRNLVWKSSNPKVAKYDEDHGTIRAYKPGKATITVKTHNNKKATCKVTVVAPEPTTLTLNTTALYLRIGETFQLVPTIDEGAQTTFKYTSKNKKIASVSSNGLVKGKKKGSTSITVKTKNGLKVTIPVEVGSFTPYKSGTSGIKVYTTVSDRFFHLKASCSLVSDTPSRITLETALNYGKKPCPECASSAAKTVYLTGKTKTYHYSKHHAGNDAEKSTLAVAKALGYKACSDCTGN